MNRPTKTVKEKTWKLSSTVQYKTYTTATDMTAKVFFLDFYLLLLFGCFFFRAGIVSELGVVCVA